MTKIISKQSYEDAGEAWVKARARVDASNAEAREAETALYAAEKALAEQEAAPGVPAYWHDEQVTKERCRIGRTCRIHGDGPDPW